MDVLEPLVEIIDWTVSRLAIFVAVGVSLGEAPWMERLGAMALWGGLVCFSRGALNYVRR